MSFIRHVGKHGDRKVAVIFREVPGEPHMCLVTYTELLNQNIHDPMIQCIESDIGQNSPNLSDALNRSFTRDGRSILQVLHAEGQLKKVNTELIVMTPQPNVKIKLSELNTILDEMQKGEDAVKKLAEMDQSLGLQNPQEVARRMRGDTKQQTAPVQASTDGVLGDNALANNLRQQAAKMAAEAKGLLAESDRLLKEAAAMDPVKLETKPAKQSKVVATSPPAPTKRGRPAKAKVTA